MDRPKQLFIDTSAFKALVDTKDDFHQKAKTIWVKLEKQKSDVSLMTSNYVLDESFTLIRARSGIDTVQYFRTVLAASPELAIVRVTVSDEANAWNWFTKDWSSLSFTDCVSFALMKRLKITSVVTFDQHFTRAGFEIF